MGGSDRLLTELTVTPIIRRAVEVLRAAIPKQFIQAGVIGIRVSFTEFGNSEPSFEYAEWVRQAPDLNLRLTDVQESAAAMLVGLAAFYNDHWEEACGVTEKITPQFGALRDRFNRDVRRRLNIEIEGYTYDRHLNGHVTVYI